MVSIDGPAFVVSREMTSENCLKIFLVSPDRKISGLPVVDGDVLNNTGLVDKVLKVFLVCLGLSRIRMNIGL